MQKQKSHTSGVVANATLSVKRRYLNLVHDGHRQQQIEMFVGINIARYFPTLSYFCPYEYISSKANPDSDVEEEVKPAPPAQQQEPVAESPMADLLGLEM